MARHSDKLVPPLKQLPEYPVDCREAALLLGVSCSFLSYLRRNKRGPLWTYQGRRCVYDRESVLAWKESSASQVSLVQAARILGVSRQWLIHAFAKTGMLQAESHRQRAYDMRKIETWFTKTFGGRKGLQGLLTASDIARRLNCSRSMITILKKRHVLPEPFIVYGKKAYWDEEEFLLWREVNHAGR